MPLISIDVATLSGQPLFLRRTIIGGQMLVDDYIVVCADLTLARVMRVPKSFGRATWDWHITGPVMPPEMGPPNGSDATLDQAKASVRAVFDRWLAWARVTPHGAGWHE